MSRGSNNMMPAPADWQTRHDYGGFYPAYYNDHNYNLFSPLVPSLMSPLNPFRGANDVWWGMNEGGARERHLLARFPLEPPSPLAIIVLDNGIRRELSSGFTGQSNFQAPSFSWEENSSRLTPDEQKKALEKLKKVTYNPAPKNVASRLCLYYRDKGRNIINQMENEEGKRCAVCLEDFEPNALVMLTPCNHMFHEECIVPWIKSQGRCPVCRAFLFKRTGGTVGTSNTSNAADVSTTDDLSTGEIFSMVRAMEEASIRRNALR